MINMSPELLYALTLTGILGGVAYVVKSIVYLIYRLFALLLKWLRGNKKNTIEEIKEDSIKQKELIKPIEKELNEPKIQLIYD